MEMEKQMLGERVFAEPADTMGQSGLWPPGPADFPTTPGPYSLQRSLAIALIWEQALYRDSFRQLGEGQSFSLRLLALIVFSSK